MPAAKKNLSKNKKRIQVNKTAKKRIEPKNFTQVEKQRNNTAEIKNNRKSKPINLYRKIAFSFIFLTIILLIVVFYFSFAKATIILIPNQEKINDNLAIDVYNKGIQKTGSQQVLTGAVEKIEIEEAKTYSAGGKEIIGQEVVGKVTLINNYDKNQPLVATTRLLSSTDKLFRIKNTITIPAGGSVEAEIYADEPSADMAIGPSKFTIPGLWAGLQEKIYAESKAKFIYQEQAKKFIEQADIDKALKDLKASLLEKASKQIGKSYKGFDKVIYELDENSISTEIDGKVGEEKDKFKISMKAMVGIIAFSSEEAAKIAQNKLLTIVPDNKELIDFSKSEIEYSLKNKNTDQGKATIEILFSGKMCLKEGEDLINREKITGLTKAQLEDYLNSFKEIAGYEISFSPSFRDKVPNLIDRIDIKIKK